MLVVLVVRRRVGTITTLVTPTAILLVMAITTIPIGVVLGVGVLVVRSC